MHRRILPFLLLLGLTASWMAAAPRQLAPGKKGLVILLVDNSRSVPRMDPTRSREDVLRTLVSSLEDFETRLILFGGRNEIILDNPSAQSNGGWHTDYNYAFQSAMRVLDEYIPKPPARIILVTDGVPDAFPEDYREESFSSKDEAMAFSRSETLGLLEERHVPTYVVLLGSSYDRDYMERITVKANGFARANPLVEKAALFLDNNGSLLRQFLYIVPSNAPMAELVKITRRIVTESNPRLEWALFLLIVIPILVLTVLSLRSFPAPGDTEILKLEEGVPIYLGTGNQDPLVLANPDHVRRKVGLQHVLDSNYAQASFVYLKTPIDFSPKDLPGLSQLDPIYRSLLEEDIRRIPERLQHMENSSSDDEVIAATNLHYYCSDLDPERIRSILLARGTSRKSISCEDFLKAKIYVALAPDMLQELTEYKVLVSVPAMQLMRAEASPGMTLKIGRLTMTLADIQTDAQFGASLVLEYRRMPTFMGIKLWMPHPIQRVLRLRGTTRNLFTGTGR